VRLSAGRSHCRTSGGKAEASNEGVTFDSQFTNAMNKRAKKRLKETIAKDKQERAKSLPQQRPGSAKDPQQLRGFLPKPEKKRG
jgi:hypothetical protein